MSHIQSDHALYNLAANQSTRCQGRGVNGGWVEGIATWEPLCACSRADEIRCCRR